MASAPGHVANVRHHVFEVLSPEQVAQLAGITDAIVDRLDPNGVMTAPCRRPTAPGLSIAPRSSGDRLAGDEVGP